MGKIDREGPIHKAVLRWLRLQYPQAAFLHPANEAVGKLASYGGPKEKGRARVIQGNAKAMGMRAGAPDLVVVLNGRPIALEVKAEGNYQQGNQKAFQRDWEAAGGFYAVVRSVDDAQEAMREATDTRQQIGDIAAGMVRGELK